MISSNLRKPLMIVITGPTASGKSALAVEVAHRLGTEVISADSRQIYHGIPVATATPGPEEMRGIPHHLIDILPLDAYYSASEFEQDALRISKELFDRDKVAVVCGGSMMYVDALCHGIDELPTVPPEIRGSLMKEWKDKGDGWLTARLAELDPVHHANVDLRNMKRVFHAVEITLAAGRPYSSLITGRKQSRDFRILKICLDGDRPYLFDRINRRVENMMEAGLEEEAKRVYPMRNLNSLNTVGLKEMFSYFDGLLTKDEAVARIQKNTRVYAKKQITWFKRDSLIIRLPFEYSPGRNAESILSMI